MYCTLKLKKFKIDNLPFFFKSEIFIIQTIRLYQIISNKNICTN